VSEEQRLAQKGIIIESAVNDLLLAFHGAAPVVQLLQHLREVPQSVLEVGCGSGKLSLHIALQQVLLGTGGSVTLLDPDPDMEHYARSLTKAAWHLLHGVGILHNESALHLAPIVVNGDGRNLTQPSDSYDLVWDEGLPEHLTPEDQVKLVKEMARVSKRYVCLIVPDAAHPESQRVSNEVHHHYHGLPEKEVPFTAEEARALVVSAGLELLVLEPCMERFHFLLCLKPGGTPPPAPAVRAQLPVEAPPPVHFTEAEPLDIRSLER
jgi:SAM-dependent methyltransferase